MRKTLTLLAALAALTACSSEPADSDEPTVADTPSAAAPSTSGPQDVTAELKASGQPWAGLVDSATQTEPGRVEVKTSIVDPRGDAGSPAAQQALDVCEGAAAWLQSTGVSAPKVSVFEADGSTFVVAGHPSYGAACTEV